MSFQWSNRVHVCSPLQSTEYCHTHFIALFLHSTPLEVLIDISILRMQKLRLTLRKWSDEDVSPTSALFPADLQEEEENWIGMPFHHHGIASVPRGSPWTFSLPHPQHSLPWSTERPLVVIHATHSQTSIVGSRSGNGHHSNIHHIPSPAHAHLIVSQPSSEKEVLRLLSNKWGELYTDELNCIKKEILLAPRFEVKESPWSQPNFW